MKNPIHINKAPDAIGPYSQAIKTKDIVYFSGQIALDPTSKTLVEGGIQAQIVQVFENIKAVAEAAGGDLNHIVKLTVYLIDIAHLAQVSEVMTQYFSPPYPARTSIAVSALPKGALVEVEALMAVM